MNAQTSSYAWLRCTLTPGQFDDEFAVSGHLADGTGFSLFAPKEYINYDQNPSFDHPVSGAIRVELMTRQGGSALVLLPRQALENGRAVTVKAAQLSSRDEKERIE
jgi:hypothetical protein